MRVEPSSSFVPGIPSQLSVASNADLPFGAMFLAASKEDGSRITEQEDGSFKMQSSADDLEGSDVLKKEDSADEIAIETTFIQVLVSPSAFGLGQPSGGLSAIVSREVRSFFAAPGMVFQETPVAMHIRFEKSERGLVVVIHLNGADLTEMATQKKGLLQKSLSDVLDRSVVVRFVDNTTFEQTLDETAGSQQGFGQNQQDRPREQPDRSFVQEEEDVLDV